MRRHKSGQIKKLMGVVTIMHNKFVPAGIGSVLYLVVVVPQKHGPYRLVSNIMLIRASID